MNVLKKTIEVLLRSIYSVTAQSFYSYLCFREDNIPQLEDISDFLKGNLDFRSHALFCFSRKELHHGSEQLKQKFDFFFFFFFFLGGGGGGGGASFTSFYRLASRNVR